MELDHTNAALYRGTKELKAWPMGRGDYVAYRGWGLPDGENPGDAGYLVEYIDGGKPNDERHSGYISWSPADVFEKTYFRVADLLAQGEANEAAWQANSRRGHALNSATCIFHGTSNTGGTVDAAKVFETYLAGPNEPTTWQERLEAERVELYDRRAKLHTFIESDDFDALPPRVRTLMEKQYVLMDELYGVLVERRRD